MPTEPHQSFERRATDQTPSLMAEFLAFLRHNKKWWLLPIIAIVLVLGSVLYLGTTIAAPFIYTLF